nr:UvrD-helicase domain-containing protein [Hyphomonas sp. 34-62-18]
MSERARHQEAFEAAVKAQAGAANPNVSAFATANAGSGKTKVLIDRVARLLLRREDGRPGAEPDSILCVTYTRAAANEMLTRLFRTLGDWAVKEDDSLREALAKLEGRIPESYSRDDLRDARRLFARALETPGGLRIETIHAFCARILRRFPLEAGVVPGFTEMEDRDARALWQAAKERAILEAAKFAPGDLALITREAMNEGASSALDALKASGAAVMRFAERHDFVIDRMMKALRADLGAPHETPEEILATAMGEALPRDAIREALRALLTGTTTDQKRAEALEQTLTAETPEAIWAAYAPFFLTEKGEFRAQNPYTKKIGELYPLLPEYFQITLRGRLR